LNWREDDEHLFDVMYEYIIRTQ